MLCELTESLVKLLLLVISLLYCHCMVTKIIEVSEMRCSKQHRRELFMSIIVRRKYDQFISASLSIEQSVNVIERLSVRTCELWQNG